MGRLRLLGEPEDGGTDDHSALSNLGYVQSGHTGFVPSQGEALIDILRLNQNLIRDSGGNNRITLSPASPHATLTGDLLVSGHLAAGGASVQGYRLATIDGSLTTQPAIGAYARIYGTKPGGGPQFTQGLAGGAFGQGFPSAAYVYGLYFFAQHNTPSPCGQLFAQYLLLQSGASGSGGLTLAKGIYLGPASWANSKPVTIYAIDITQQGGAGVATAYGLRIADQTAASVRLLELGPTTPYLRLLGGGDPPANKSNLYLKFGSTLYRVVKTGNYMSLEAA